MTSASEFQRLADECLAWARGATTDAERKTFLDMARSWSQAAARVGGGLGPIPVAPISADSDSNIAP